MKTDINPLHIGLLTSITMVAFAANSILCRLALEAPSLNATSFTTVRLLSGAVALWLIMRIFKRKNPSGETGLWYSTLTLFIYTHLTRKGIILAVISGALTSGCGYVIWYAALRGLTATQASMVQLSVPILAALGGVVFLSEVVTVRLLVSCILILGGLAAALK